VVKIRLMFPYKRAGVRQRVQAAFYYEGARLVKILDEFFIYLGFGVHLQVRYGLAGKAVVYAHGGIVRVQFHFNGGFFSGGSSAEEKTGNRARAAQRRSFIRSII
jgi:hypothetical protein